MEPKNSQVVVGIICNSQQEIFIALREGEKDFVGYWEFPGGKMEAHETPELALKRELWEEAGIAVEEYYSLKSFDYIYPHKRLTLHFFLVTAWDGDPYGREGQQVRWLARQQLDPAQFPPANRAIIAHLQEE